MADLFVSVVASPWNGYQYKYKLLQLKMKLSSPAALQILVGFKASDGGKE